MKNRLVLHINHEEQVAFSAKGLEALNTPFEFLIQTVASSFEVAKSWLNGHVVLKIIANDYSSRVFVGCITRVHPRGHHLHLGYYVEIVMHSSMWKQSLRGGVRFFLNHSAIDIVKKLLSEQAIWAGASTFQLSRAYETYPLVHQVFDETNLHFINRILAREGIYWWTQADEHQNEHVYFSDQAPTQAPRVHRDNINVVNSYSAEAYDPNFVGMHRFKLRHRWMPVSHTVSAYNDNTPSDIQKATAGKDSLNAHYYGTGSLSTVSVEKEAMLRERYLQSERKILEAAGNVAEMIVGHQLKIENEWYFIKKITHDIRPHDGSDEPEKECIYINEWVGSPVDLPYAPLIIDHRAITPPYIIAHVESDSSHATLNNQGYYKVRFNCDLSDRPKTEASPWIRCMQLSGGSLSKLGAPVGFHSPLYDGAEVLIGFLQNDPDRPVIVGSLPNKMNPSVVTNENAHENRWRTLADNELKMVDAPGEESVILRTYSGLNHLTLDATANNHQVTLESQTGLLQIHAERAIELTTEKDTLEDIGHNKVETVQENYEMEVKGQVCYQAEKNITVRADHSISVSGEKGIHYQAGKKLNIKAGGGDITSEEGDICFDIEQGKVSITADEISIQGNGAGDIEFSLGENVPVAGFKIDKAGNITLFGDNISLEADNIILEGIVESTSIPVPKPSVGFAGMVMKPKEAFELYAEPAPQDFDSKVIDEFELFFTNKKHLLLKEAPFELKGDQATEKKSLTHNKISKNLEKEVVLTGLAILNGEQ